MQKAWKSLTEDERQALTLCFLDDGACSAPWKKWSVAKGVKAEVLCAQRVALLEGVRVISGSMVCMWCHITLAQRFMLLQNAGRRILYMSRLYNRSILAHK
eukprot:5292338-Amphidinium_carterae.2